MLTKVVQQLFTATNRRFSIGCHFLKKMFGVIAFCYRFVFVEFLQLNNVFVTVEHQASCLKSITSATSSFLIIPFKGFRSVVVNNKTNIWFIYTHAEGNGCYNYFNFFIQESILIGHAY